MPLVVKKNKMLKGSNNEMEQQDQTTIIHEVKRVGLLIDRYIDLELRVGEATTSSYTLVKAKHDIQFWQKKI